MSRCRHNSSDPSQRPVTCTHPEASADFGATPHRAVCLHCPHYDGPARGIGDAVVTVIRRVRPGHTPCGSCQKRRERLNSILPTQASG